MTQLPRVSVIMTAYNRATYIAAAIESVLAQVFTDFELVIVDDCSTDETVAVARRYLADPRVRVVVNERNLGDYPNRNHAVTFARGQFLKYHDSDDIMYPHCLSVLVDALEAVPDAAFALSSSRGWPGGPCPIRLTPRLAYEREFIGSGLFHLGPAGAMFRTTQFSDLGGFPSFGGSSDYVFWMRACARVNVVLAAGDLFWYRVHAGQYAHEACAVREAAIASGEAWRALNAPECPLLGSDLFRARRNWAWTVARGAVRALRAGQFRYARDIVRFSGLTPWNWIRYLRAPVRDPAAGTPALGEVHARH